MSLSANDLLESLLNESSLNLSQIKSIYSSFEDYQVNLCSLSEANTSLTRAFSAIGNSFNLKAFVNFACVF